MNDSHKLQSEGQELGTEEGPNVVKGPVLV